MFSKIDNLKLAIKLQIKLLKNPASSPCCCLSKVSWNSVRRTISCFFFNLVPSQWKLEQWIMSNVDYGFQPCKSCATNLKKRQNVAEMCWDSSPCFQQSNTIMQPWNYCRSSPPTTACRFRKTKRCCTYTLHTWHSVCCVCAIDQVSSNFTAQAVFPRDCAIIR